MISTLFDMVLEDLEWSQLDIFVSWMRLDSISCTQFVDEIKRIENFIQSSKGVKAKKFVELLSCMMDKPDSRLKIVYDYKMDALERFQKVQISNERFDTFDGVDVGLLIKQWREDSNIPSPWTVVNLDNFKVNGEVLVYNINNILLDLKVSDLPMTDEHISRAENFYNSGKVMGVKMNCYGETYYPVYDREMVESW